MKNIFKISSLALVALVAFSSCSSGNNEEAEVLVPEVVEGKKVVYTLDPTTSEITWTGNMLGMYAHQGTLKILSGSVVLEDGQLTGGDVVVDMRSITPTDNGYSKEKSKEMLIGHLSSPDFFDVENYPTAVVKIISSDKVALTIRGVTETVELNHYDLYPEAETFRVKGEITFDRKKFGVAFDHPVKENVISDEVELMFILNGKALEL